MKHSKSERGQSLVEFAISLVILLMLLAGAAEFGIVFFQYVQLRDAAQEGALYGSTNPSDINGIKARIRASSDKPLDLQNDPLVVINISIDGDGKACEGRGLTVTVSYTHHVFMPFIPRTEIPLNATVTDTILSPFTCP
jgi:TadE-like protein/Prokaryotic N-terminal methylation motif